MSQLVDHLAELTGFRDRDIVDVTLVSALHDLLNPISVAIYRVVGEGGDERWITRARLGESDAVATADPAWADPESLPRLDQYPARVQAMAGETSIVTMPGALSRSIFPVRTDREVVGVMEVESRVPLRDEDVRMVTSILRIYRNFQGLLDYSERDTLTGLLNRKTFDESFLKATSAPPMSAAMSQAATPDGRRHAASAHRHWLGVIDIDHFKSVNDTYGHLIGDEVLLLLSRLMRSSFRFHDRLYRFGGEEFVLVLVSEGFDGVPWLATPHIAGGVLQRAEGDQPRVLARLTRRAQPRLDVHALVASHPSDGRRRTRPPRRNAERPLLPPHAPRSPRPSRSPQARRAPRRWRGARPANRGATP